jgi:hypothetical protein
MPKLPLFALIFPNFLTSIQLMPDLCPRPLYICPTYPVFPNLCQIPLLFTSSFKLLNLCSTHVKLIPSSSNYAKFPQFPSIMPHFPTYAKVIAFCLACAKLFHLCPVMPTYQNFPKLSIFFLCFSHLCQTSNLLPNFSQTFHVFF